MYIYEVAKSLGFCFRQEKLKQNKPVNQLDTDNFISQIQDTLISFLPNDPSGKQKHAIHIDKSKAFEFIPDVAGKPENVIPPSRVISDVAMQKMESLQKK